MDALTGRDLPDELVLSRNPGGRAAIVKAFVVSGFIREGVFYSRDEAAAHAATMLETESAFDTWRWAKDRSALRSESKV
jgi:hypothetical protein